MKDFSIVDKGKNTKRLKLKTNLENSNSAQCFSIKRTELTPIMLTTDLCELKELNTDNLNKHVTQNYTNTKL